MLFFDWFAEFFFNIGLIERRLWRCQVRYPHSLKRSAYKTRVLLCKRLFGSGQDLIIRAQSTATFLCIQPFSVTNNNNQTNNRVILFLVQACSWPVRRQSFAKTGAVESEAVNAMKAIENIWGSKMSELLRQGCPQARSNNSFIACNEAPCPSRWARSSSSSSSE